MFQDQQNKLGYCHITVVVEVIKPTIIGNVVHQGLQGSYFSIHYFFQNPINQMYVLSCCVNFIWNAIVMNNMK